MDGKYRVCPVCGEKQPLELYLPTSNSCPYSINGASVICVVCMGQHIDRYKLETIDKMCQYLDLPFDANRWTEMEKDYEKLGPLLIDYCYEMRNGEYQDSDWQQVNSLWKKAREYNGLVDQMTAMHSDLLLYLRKKWGASSDLVLDDYLRMEEYERHTLSHYPFKDEARKDVIRKLAKISVLSDKSITAGNTKDAVSYLQAYNTLMKELGIGNEIANNEDSINTLSELVSYLEKKGFVLNYRINESRDVVDKTIENMQQYVRRLFNDSQETVTEMYNQKSFNKTYIFFSIFLAIFSMENIYSEGYYLPENSRFIKTGYSIKNLCWNPNNTTFAYTEGNLVLIRNAETFELINSIEIPNIENLNENKLIFIPKKDSKQAQVLRGWTVPTYTEEDYPKLVVMNNILGSAGLSSRLFVELRDKKGLAYTVRSSYEPMKRGAILYFYIAYRFLIYFFYFFKIHFCKTENFSLLDK